MILEYESIQKRWKCSKCGFIENISLTLPITEIRRRLEHVCSRCGHVDYIDIFMHSGKMEEKVLAAMREIVNESQTLCSETLADKLKVSRRQARNWLNEFVNRGILMPIERKQHGWTYKLGGNNQ